MPNPARSRVDELVLVGDAEQWVRDPLTTERGGALGAAGRRAERSGAMGRVDGEVVGQLVVAAQRVEHLAGQRFGPLGCRTDRSVRRCRPSATHRRTAPPAGRSGAGRRRGGPACARASPPPATRRSRPARPCRRRRRDGAVRPAVTRRGRRTPRRCGGQAGAAGHVVGVGMRIQGPRHSQPRASGGLLVGGREAGRIDDRRRPVAQVDQVRRMTQPLVTKPCTRITSSSK